MKFMTKLLLVILFTLNIGQVQANSFDPLLRDGSSAYFWMNDGKLKYENGDPVKYKISYTKWIPRNQNGHAIVYNHGMQSHMGWFFPTAEKLADLGFTVYAFDRIGSGKSSDGGYSHTTYEYTSPFLDEEPVSPVKEIRFKKGHIRSWKLLTKTLGKMVDIVQDENPKIQINIWGNSFGAKIITAYMLQTNDLRVNSLVFTTPGLYRNNVSMPLPFRTVEVLIAPKQKHFPTPIKAKNNDRGAHWFTSNPEWFDRIKEDDLSQRKFTKSFYMQTKKIDSYIAKKSLATTTLKKVPQFYAMIQNDPMMDNVKTIKHIASLNNSKARYKFFQGGADHRHFLTFTRDGNKAIGDIVNFLLGDQDYINYLK